MTTETKVPEGAISGAQFLDVPCTCQCWVKEGEPEWHWPDCARVPKGKVEPGNVMDLGNAHLIAAAADLLAACKASLALGRKIYHNANAHEAPMDWAHVRKLLEIAIAKAEGRV